MSSTPVWSESPLPAEFLVQQVLSVPARGLFVVLAESNITFFTSVFTSTDDGLTWVNVHTFTNTAVILDYSPSLDMFIVVWDDVGDAELVIAERNVLNTADVTTQRMLLSMQALLAQPRSTLMAHGRCVRGRAPLISQ